MAGEPVDPDTLKLFILGNATCSPRIYCNHKHVHTVKGSTVVPSELGLFAAIDMKEGQHVGEYILLLLSKYVLTPRFIPLSLPWGFSIGQKRHAIGQEDRDKWESDRHHET